MSRLLFLAASPAGWMPVSVALEHSGIHDAIQRSRYRAQLQPQARLQGGVGDVWTALAKCRPHIVHFVGHGTADGQVVLAQGAEEEQLTVDGVLLDALFEPLKGQVKLVVLNACHTSKLAARLAERVGCAIGMRSNIRNTEANQFAETFYGALGDGASVQAAFTFASACLSEPRREIPVLHDPRGQAQSLYFAGPAALWPHPRTRLGIAALALVVGVGATAAWLTRRSSDAGANTPTRMIMITGGQLSAGVDAATAKEAYLRCMREYAEEATRQCGETFERSPFQREIEPRAARTEVATFLLDAHEVTSGQLAVWLTQQRDKLTLIRDPGQLARLGLPGPVVSLEGQWLTCVQIEHEASHRAITIRATNDGYVAPQAVAEHPARLVSWRAADAYCAAQGKRLPDAEEWEWAARGADRRRYPWGDAPPACDAVTFGRRPHGPCDTGGLQTSRVASGADVTPAGVFDLGGNLSEWTQPPNGERSTATALMPIRGGTYQDEPVFLEGSRRFRGHPQAAYVHVGFRCARDHAR